MVGQPRTDPGRMPPAMRGLESRVTRSDVGGRLALQGLGEVTLGFHGKIIGLFENFCKLAAR